MKVFVEEREMTVMLAGGPVRQRAVPTQRAPRRRCVTSEVAALSRSAPSATTTASASSGTSRSGCLPPEEGREARHARRPRDPRLGVAPQAAGGIAEDRFVRKASNRKKAERLVGTAGPTQNSWRADRPEGCAPRRFVQFAAHVAFARPDFSPLVKMSARCSRSRKRGRQQ